MRKYILRIALLFLLIGTLVQLTAQVLFSPGGGNYAEPVAVSLEARSNSVIRFTLDGSRPTSSSPEWIAGETRMISKSSVLRAIVVDEDGKSSYPVGATYLVGEPATKLPIISIGIDPWRLFSKKNGWFEPGPRADHSHWKIPGANWWTKDEYPGHLDLYEPDGITMFSGQVGYRVFGGMSRLHQQKSISISCRKKYGSKRIEYPVFGEAEQEDFKYLVFRNGGSDWSRSHFRDALLSGLIEDKSWDLDHQANRPALLYINGKYWGLYHIREKINKTFVADRRGYDKNELDLLEHESTVKAGSGKEYEKIVLFLNQHSFYEVPTFLQLREMMDVDNFMRHQIAQVYFDNRDAGGNIRYYRPHKPDELGVQKWRWILYDLDYSFGLHEPASYAHNTLAVNAQVDGPLWPNPPWSTLIQRKLLANDEYRRFFVNRSLDYLQTDFSAQTVLTAIDEKVGVMQPEMRRALKRWDLPMNNWQFHVDRMKEFARLRPEHLREHLRGFFGGGEDREVKLETSRGGGIVLNDNLTITAPQWQGNYFANVPLRIRAKPAPGHRFVGWESEQISEKEQMQHDVPLRENEPYTFTARFEPVLHELAGQVMITEIGGQKSSGGSWVEIYNGSTKTVHLRDWLIANDDEAEVRLPSLSVLARSYIVLRGAGGEFDEKFPGALAAFELAGLKGLLRTGKIGLYSKRGALVDEAEFPVAQNLVHAVSESPGNNDDVRNWFDLTDSPTPGGRNDISPLQMSLHTGDIWWRVMMGLGVLLVLGYALRKRT